MIFRRGIRSSIRALREPGDDPAQEGPLAAGLDRNRSRPGQLNDEAFADALVACVHELTGRAGAQHG